MAIFNGTDGNDNLIGTPEDDRFFISDGQDLIDGGDGIDILDFSTLRRQPITLTLGVDFVRPGPPPAPPQPVAINRITQGGRTIEFRNIETIIAPAGQENTLVSGIIANRGAGSIVDLEARTISAFSDLVAVDLRVENFRNVTGTFFGDTLVGDRRDNILIGGSGIDVLSGAGGNDRLFGGDNFDARATSGVEVLDGGSGNDILRGAGDDRTSTPTERDILTGGTGADTFVFAQVGDSFDYQDFGSNRFSFAEISDFGRRDTIQLSSQLTYQIQLKSKGFNLSVLVDGNADLIAQVNVVGTGVRSRVAQFVNGLPDRATFTIGAGEELVDGLLAGV
jgi:Ca2+-binding RTX toxin-like protein